MTVNFPVTALQQTNQFNINILLKFHTQVYMETPRLEFVQIHPHSDWQLSIIATSVLSISIMCLQAIMSSVACNLCKHQWRMSTGDLMHSNGHLTPVGESLLAGGPRGVID